MRVELIALKNKNIWIEVFKDKAEQQKKISIFTIWMFKYKFNDQRFFAKYKARFCA